MLSEFLKMQKKLLIDDLKEERFSKEILNAFSKVPRENFVPMEFTDRAYENAPLPIGFNQTISQPYTIAMMLSLLDLKKNQKVLEIGSGCGYVLALLSEIAGKKGEVFGVEIIPELFQKSKDHLRDYKNAFVYGGNGRIGLKEKGKFDRILISAAADDIPEPLIKQLKNLGIVVSPIKEKYGQSLMVYKKIKGKLKKIKEIPGFIFVPLIGGD